MVPCWLLYCARLNHSIRKQRGSERVRVTKPTDQPSRPSCALEVHECLWPDLRGRARFALCLKAAQEPTHAPSSPRTQLAAHSTIKTNNTARDWYLFNRPLLYHMLLTIVPSCACVCIPSSMPCLPAWPWSSAAQVFCLVLEVLSLVPIQWNEEKKEDWRDPP